MITAPAILLVDDSMHDVLLMTTVFQRTDYPQPLRSVSSGDEAIAYLRGEGRYANRTEFPLPALVLLDLNMPRRNGFEVLDWIRRQPELRRLSVYVLSASGRQVDIDRAYALGANAYLVKPGTLDELVHLAKTLVAWIRLGHFSPLAAPEAAAELEPVPVAPPPVRQRVIAPPWGR